jgi:hypothetical protein
MEGIHFFRRTSRASDVVVICYYAFLLIDSAAFGLLSWFMSADIAMIAIFLGEWRLLNVKTVFTYASSWRFVRKICMPKECVQLI